MENIIALKRKLETRVLEVLDQIFENTPMIAEIFYLSTAYNEEGTFSSISKSKDWYSNSSSPTSIE